MAVGFRKSAPVVATGRGGSSTLAALDQERSRTSSARAPLLPTACGIGGMPTRDKVSDNYGRRSALTQTLSDASLQVSLAKPLEQTTQRTLDTEEVTGSLDRDAAVGEQRDEGVQKLPRSPPTAPRLGGHLLLRQLVLREHLNASRRPGQSAPRELGLRVARGATPSRRPPPTAPTFCGRSPTAFRRGGC